MSTILQDTRLHVAAGFLLMGGWAYFANSGHGPVAALTAGFVQGCLSSLLTFILKSTVDRLRPTFPGTNGYILPPLLALALSSAILITTHWLAGTPEIATTIAVPLFIASSYICIYNLLAKKKEDKENG